MDEPSFELEASERPFEKRLDSWKEIASYLSRDVTTVQRWEKREGMPVHRHLHEKRGSVYAVASELTAWVESRRPSVDENEKRPDAKALACAEENLGPSARARTYHWLALAMIAAGLLATTYLAYRGRTHYAGRTTVKSLAVLPLKNLSGDRTQEYLADGMTEALIGRLSGIHDLRVISHTSVRRFKNPQLSVPEIARTLGVDAIVEGSVIRDGDRIRITAQLIRGTTDEHFWSETYDRQLRDALGLESDVAQAVAKKVEVTVTGEEQRRLGATRSVAPEVYESYLKGLFVLRRSSDKAGIDESTHYFEDAIKRDATFAPAYLGLADASEKLGTIFIGAPPGEMRERVTRAAEKALQLDPGLADAHVLLADVKQRQWHWAEAEAEYRRALELNPNDAAAHAGLATWMLCQGRTDEALAWARRGRELDPVAVDGAEVAWIQFSARRYDEAERELRSVLSVQPAEANALWDLGFVLVANNRPTEAIPVLEHAAAVSNRSPGVLGVLIRAYARAGRRNDAIRLLAELKRRKQTGYVPAGAFVNAYLGLDEREEAFAAIEEAYREQSNILQFVKVHPFFDPLRGDPRFAELVRRVGLS